MYTTLLELIVRISNKQVPSQIWDTKEGEDRKGEKRLMLLLFNSMRPG